MKLAERVSIYKGDITKLEIDAIVNAANSRLKAGGGVDGAIHRAAGPLLQDECNSLGGCATGEAKATSGYDLPAKYVIHTVGPQDGSAPKLQSCYENCLALKSECHFRSIAFPCISTATSALENSEDLENHPLVRMEDVQPDRSCEVLNIQQIDCVNSIEDACLLNDDDDSNIGSMVSIQSEEVIDYQDDSSDNAELIVPDILEPRQDESHSAAEMLKQKAPESWPTLEILPGGVIKNADKYEDDLSLTCPVTDRNKNEVKDMKYVCAKCSESFDNLILLVKHVRWHEEERKKENELKKLKQQSIEKCYIQTCKRKIISEKKTKRKVPKKS
ncbi:unnamed protein product, partial [Iphiclides podalirius]